MKRSHLPANAGSSLLAVLFTMATIAALTAAIFSVTSANVALARRTSNRTVALAYADGVVESLFDQWRNAMIAVTNATDRASGLSNSSLAAALTAPSSTTLPLPSGVTLASWSVTARTPLLAATTDGSGRPIAENGTNSVLRVRIYYLATVTVNFRTPAGTGSLTVQRVFLRSGRNLFDNFFFGAQPNIEFHPGAPMYVTGTAYIGGDLFTAHDDLHFMSDVSFLGDHTLNYRPEDPRYGTAPTIVADGLADNWDVNNPPHYGGQQKLLDTPLSSLDSNFIDDPSANDSDSDSNPNNDGYHEIIEEQSPVTSTTPDPLQLDSTNSERLSRNADYRVYVDASNNVTIYKGLSTTPLTGSEATAITSAVTTNTALRDVREGDNVRVVTLDVSKVTAAYAASTIVDSVGGGDGLLFYIADSSAGASVSTKVVDSSSGASTNVTSSSKRGVKLVKGASLPSCGLAVVSPNSVYIQGDYNTGMTSSSQPPSNTATSYTPPVDNPNPYVSGYNRAAAAVVGDAVNILSNNWNDANSLLSRSSRIASNTTVNTAIVAGNVPTTTASYSGGIENFTRFHEEWSGRYITIYGALALLFDSEQAKGTWATADYGAPNRRWYYDTLLQDHNPPGFRVARTYERGAWIQH